MSQTTFDKSLELFPIRKHEVFLGHCSVSPLYSGANQRVTAFSASHAQNGIGLFADYGELKSSVRSKFAKLFHTTPENISLLSNTSEGINLIANGYPFAPG